MSVPSMFVELCEAQQDKKISNVIGVVIDVLPPTTTRTGDHMLTFTLDDSTLQHGQKCRLFTKKAEDLPRINGLGDVVLLRKVRFSYPNGQPLLSSVYSEPVTWAVFHAPIPKDMGMFDAGIKHVRSKKAPMVTKQEMEYVISLGQAQDRSKFTVLTDTVKEKLATNSKAQVCLLRDLVLDSFCHIVGEVVKIFFNYDRASLYITDYTENSQLYDYSSKTKDVSDDENQRRWNGPPGKYTLMIECWSPHSDWLRQHVQVGDVLRLRNVHIKANKDKQGLIEAALHTDKVHPDTVYTTKLKTQDAQALLLRKESLGWADGFDVQSDKDSDRKNKKKRKSDEPEKLTKAQKRRMRDKENKKHATLESKTAPNLVEVHRAETTRTEIRKALATVNENIRCEKGDYPKRSIVEIRDTSQTHIVSLPNGQKVTMDFIETTSYATVRVIDFKPMRLEDFARSVEMTEEEQQQAEENGDDESDAGSDHSVTSLLNKSTQVRRRKWEWNFHLLLEDASTPDGSDEKDRQRNQLIVHISGANAEYLLGAKALNIRANPRTLAQLKEKLFLLWGDLEEQKEEAHHRKKKRLSQTLAEVSGNTSGTASSSPVEDINPSSKPFRCLIEEYGEHIGNRWHRKFTMKGTTIVQELVPSTMKTTVDDRHEIESEDTDDDTEPSGITKVPVRSFRAPRAA